ncbi:unnamed protein product [Ilex paraguariensis]|uniref:heme oxygenase (biliverdin-producing) n=1 Tax=Ilex paraguariensis TaxID=185542 RepID=A0ABC8RYL1_9AQUA
MASITPISQSQPHLKKPQFNTPKKLQTHFFSTPITPNPGANSRFSIKKKCFLVTKKMVVVSPTMAAEKPKKRCSGEAMEFVEEMRFVAMKLHTRDQAKEGEKEPEGPPLAKWDPSIVGYLRFLVDSKLVYDTIERIVDKAVFPECDKGIAYP